VADRLSPLDVSFLYLEEPATPMHVGAVAVFEPPPDGFDHDSLLQLIKDRIAYVPRYRQRVRWVPGRLANPVWVDDERFDIANHVRRSALPRPGTDDQLCELVARLQARPLERSRPLWEMYLVEGLSGGRFAIVSKTHHAMVDGVAAIDIGQVILDTTPDPPRSHPGEPAIPDAWRAAPEPSWLELVAGAVGDTVRRPTALVDTLRGGLSDVRSTAGRLAGATGGLLTAALTAARPAPASPLNAVTGGQRRYAVARTDLDDYRRVRKAHGGTVNDVVLATVAGALRAWLLTRGEGVTAHTTVRAMVPMSVRTDDATDAVGVIGSRVASYLVDLPVGEPSPVMRLHQVSYRTKAHTDTGDAVGAEALVGLAGFAPPTMHALGARVASGLARRWFNLVVTNVPGPQQPLYAGAARLLAAYPVVPLAKSHAVSIGVTSYDGGVYYGLNADRDAMRDVAVLAQCLEDALAELVETVP
jgi:WS/DGAT/MGAT family acyltransferase